MTIEPIQIGVNRNAQPSSSAVVLYSNSLADNLTLGQLIISVCLRTAMAYEAMSTVKMNAITGSASLIESATDWINRILDGTASWTRAKAFLTGSLGLSAAELPENLKTYDNRLTAASAATNRIGSLMQSQQQDMVALQSYVSRRDTAFSSSTNIVRALGRSSSNMANHV